MRNPVRNSRPRLWLAATLVAAVSATTAVTAVSAQAAGCRVGYTVTNQWQGGFGANVEVTNLGDAINGWRLTWSFTAGQTITQLWNGTVAQSGSAVTVTNASYNGTIGSGGSTSFGFNGAWTGSNPVPASFALNGVTCTGTVTPTTGVPPTTTPPPTTPPPTTPPPTTPPPTTPPPGPWPPSSTFTNPVVWQDFADLDIIRVGDTYYYSASNMHYSPGAPILRSYDLVNWEFAGHSVPRLDFGSKYDLTGARGYVRGTWASTLNYRPSNRTFYWAGCIDFDNTYIYTATSVEGPWTRHATIDNCYFDAGLLVDDNDTMYVAYGNTTISVAQLSADGRSQVRSQQVFSTPSNPGVLEGARFYKRNGSYYIWLTRPANGQYVLKANNPFGPYEMRQVLLDLPGPISGGGVPHQGGLVQTQNGDWYYMSFIDAYPGGRVPALAPVSWTADGWPVLQTVNGRWGANYPYPNVPRPPRQVKPMTGTDTFAGSTLGPQWEWNHNPDNSRWSVNNGLRLQTATVTNDLYSARNTVTHRIQGPTSTATIELDYSAMRDGDRAGLAMLRQSSAWIGLRRDAGTTRVVMTNNLTMDSNWNTTSTGTEVASANVSGGRIWLRTNADIRPGSGRQARFSYSTDGVNFTTLGPAFTLNNAWQFFMGYRYAIFNYATQALGGAVTVRRFDLTTP
ncbi:family 43 glycosylhydrolase [Solwaraspora sp. WMMD1047]|uniref:family 43 glycosylhydrolase n=1 Tax=Solwaraspora sp. WMMD1047 TaxID=3016102 RepID=UPI0024180AC2|nr:family 43 glycosylhydrolase [Solwaraspora sp. WMMD1047]MDG4830800.1 family 43 glycosylhydrolase [Solwaraspora sp. WMMD1047]